MISTTEYLMGRDKEYPLTQALKENMEKLLHHVNNLSLECPIEFRVSSGYRPGKYNSAAGGSKFSAHTTCEAVDIVDSQGKIKRFLEANPKLLEACDLYAEAFASTPTWLHLTTRRPRSGNRVFIP